MLKRKDVGGFINSTQNKQELAPIHCAIASGNLPTLNLLIQAKADINIKTGEGFGALHLAAAQGANEI
jgi:ankyrin repeat protein